MTIPDTTGLTYRWRNDEGADRAAVDALRLDTFDFDVRPLDGLEARDPSYTPFSYFDDAGVCVANAAICALPLIVEGKRVEALGVQSVATRPAWRGRGLFRDLMTRALAWCDERSDLVLLTTTNPALYGRFGFHEVPQHRFVGPAPHPASAALARPISVAADLRLIKHLFATRTPVSRRVGLVNHQAMFLLAVTGKTPPGLSYMHDFDALVVWETAADGVFRLLDIVGPRIPPLAAILAALEVMPGTVEICFPPDRLDFAGEALPLKKSAGLMARGPFVGPDTRFMLPPTADF